MKLFFAALLIPLSFLAAQERPNILWLTSEDNGPQLGCYGDSYADTPNLDKLAAAGMMYRRSGERRVGEEGRSRWAPDP